VDRRRIPGALTGNVFPTSPSSRLQQAPIVRSVITGPLVHLTWFPLSALCALQEPAPLGGLEQVVQAAPPPAGVSVRERWWEPPVPEQPARAELSNLRANGLQWLGRRARVVVQYDTHVATWDPWISRYHPRAWQRLSVWGDEQFLWLRDEWERPWSQLYARSDGPAAAILSGAVRFRRYELLIEVREHLLGEARLEVLDAIPLAESVGEGAILHASRAFELWARGAENLARAEFERAQAGLLPAHARAELERLCSECTEGE